MARRITGTRLNHFPNRINADWIVFRMTEYERNTLGTGILLFGNVVAPKSGEIYTSNWSASQCCTFTHIYQGGGCINDIFIYPPFPLSKNVDPKACVLRIICETKHYLLPPGKSLFQDIFRVLFTYVVNYIHFFLHQLSIHVIWFGMILWQTARRGQRIWRRIHSGDALGWKRVPHRVCEEMSLQYLRLSAESGATHSIRFRWKSNNNK